MNQLYSTDLKYLIPLIGVLIGWLLTSLSGYFKGVTEKEKLLAKALTQLHFLYLEQRKMLDHFEYLKSTHGIGPEYEELRFKAMERYVLNNDNFKISQDIVSEVATIFPLTAMDLKGLIEGYSHAQRMKFTYSSSDSALYLKLLSAFEVTFEIGHRHLQKIILKLAFGHGVVTWMQMKWKYYKIEKLHERLKIEELLDINEDVKRVLNEQSQKIRANRFDPSK